MVSELFTIHGETDGVSNTGNFILYSDVFITDALASDPVYLRIPAGMKIKIWSTRISGVGSATNVVTLYTHDVTAVAPTWIDISTDIQDVTFESQLYSEKRRPIVVRGFSGNEAITFAWEQSAPSKAYFEAEIEYTDD